MAHIDTILALNAAREEIGRLKRVNEDLRSKLGALREENWKLLLDTPTQVVQRFKDASPLSRL